jgi:thiol-disulfide isomerase/thioredoxin
MAAEPSPAPNPSPPRRRRRIDGRTLAICVCVALIAAVIAGLVTSKVTGTSNNDAGSRRPKFGLVPAESVKIDVDKMLDTKLQTVAGAPTTLRASLGTKPLVVNLWQQSCTACVAEMPLLERVNQTDPRVALVGIDVQDRLDYAKKMAKQTGITYPWLRDDSGDFFYAAEGTQLPKTLLLSPQGKVLAVQNSTFKDRAQVDAWLQKHLS